MASQVMVFAAPAKRSLGGLAADDDRHGQHVAHEVLVHVVQDSAGILARVGFGRVRGVAFLPQKLRGAQEDSRPHLPPHDVRPLVEKQRKVAVAVDPFGHVLADDRLAGGTDGQRFGEFLASAVRHDGQLGTESLDMLGLALEEAHRHQQREVRVAGSGGLDAPVDLLVHPLPDRVSVGADDHGSAGRAVLGQLRLGEHVLVPPWKVLLLSSQHRHLRDVTESGPRKSRGYSSTHGSITTRRAPVDLSAATRNASGASSIGNR